jgi:hypothetical protein
MTEWWNGLIEFKSVYHVNMWWSVELLYCTKHRLGFTLIMICHYVSIWLRKTEWVEQWGHLSCGHGKDPPHPGSTRGQTNESVSLLAFIHAPGRLWPIGHVFCRQITHSCLTANNNSVRVPIYSDRNNGINGSSFFFYICYYIFKNMKGVLNIDSRETGVIPIYQL